MKYIVLILCLTFGCAHLNPIKNHQNLKFDEEIIWNKKKYKLYSNSDKQIAIDENEKTIEELFYSDKMNIDLKSLTEEYKIKCSQNRILRYSMKSKKIVLISDERIVLSGFSELINYHIEQDKNKKCLNQWGH